MASSIWLEYFLEYCVKQYPYIRYWNINVLKIHSYKASCVLTKDTHCIEYSILPVFIIIPTVKFLHSSEAVYSLDKLLPILYHA